MDTATELATLCSSISERVTISDTLVADLVSRYQEDSSLDLEECLVDRSISLQIEYSRDIAIDVTLPTGYPDAAPHVTLIGCVSRSCQSAVAKEVDSLLGARVDTKDPILYELVLLVIETIHSNPQADAETDQTLCLASSAAEVEMKANKEEQFSRIMFVAHHLLATSKRKAIKQFTRDYNLRIVSKIGYPGLIAAEGSSTAMQTFVKEIKAMRWHTITLKYEEVFSSNEQGSWQDNFLLLQPFCETEDMNAFASHIKSNSEWLQSIMH